MNVIAALILGLLIGFLIEWGVDWLFWRKKNDALAEELEETKAQLVMPSIDESQFQNQIATLKATSNQLESSNADLQGQVSSLETERSDLLAALSLARTENQEMKSQMDAQLASLKDDLQEIYGVGPVIETKLNEAGIFKFRQLAELDPDEFRDILGPDTERPVNEERIIALAGLAAHATEDVRGEDLQVIRGVGPVIAGLLNQAGIYTFAELGSLSQEQLEVILGEYIEHLADEADIIHQARLLAGMDTGAQEFENQIAGLETEKADLLAVIADLRAENEALASRMETQTAQLKDDLQEIYGVGPVIEGKLNEAGIYKFRQLADLDPDEFRNILGPDTERAVNEEKIISLAGLAAHATEDVRGEDLQAINGIGPVIAGLLNQAGVYTYADLGGLSQEQLEVILGEYIEHLTDEADIIQQARGLAGLDS